MKTIKLSFLLFLSLLFANCKKEATTPPELIGFKIKSITINDIPTTNLQGTCWDELNCDNEEGNPDIYFKVEQSGGFSFDQLDFFTSEVFENYSNEQVFNITVPDKVFVLGFFYSFSIYDKDGLDIGNDELVRRYTLLGDDPDRGDLQTTVGGADKALTAELEYIYE